MGSCFEPLYKGRRCFRPGVTYWPICEEWRIVEKFVAYFRSVLHHNQRYFLYFVLCEILNLILVYFNFWATDKFLQGRFKYYGYDVIKFYTLTKAERAVSVNPFCAAFPKEISCDVPAIGASGGTQWHNGFCIL